MEPISYKRNGRELGNAAAAAAICGITWESYQWYVRRGKPENNPAPGHVYVDPTTAQRMYALKDVREWHKNRKGRGNWGGEGARARDKFKQDPTGDAETDAVLADPDTVAAIDEARAETATTAAGE